MTVGPSKPDPSPADASRAGSSTPLNYEPAANLRLTARHIRWIILLAGLLMGGIVLLFNPLIFDAGPLGWGIFGTPLGPFENGALDDRLYYLIHAAGYLSLFLLTQWLFLLPRGRLSFQTSEKRRSRRASAIGAAFIGMLLTTGLVATILELTHVWHDLLGAEFSFHGLMLKGFYGIWVAMALSWLGWGLIFYWYYRDADHRTAVARMTRILMAGTVLELLVSVPAYVRTLPQADSCYCEKGSYTGLVFGCTAVFWLFGPGVYLLLLRDKRRWTAKV